MTEGTTHRLLVDEDSAGGRLDQVIARRIPDLSRSRIQHLIAAGHATVNDAEASKHHLVRAGDAICLTVPPPAPAQPAAEQIPLAILYEDEDLVAVDKPAGMVVHPAPGHAGGTLVNALLGAITNLSGIGGELRPGIIHRLDKGTSGIVVVAKNDRAHRALSAQFAERTVEKTYLAVVWGVTREEEGVIEAAIGRDTKDRKKISPNSRRPRPAVTCWWAIRHLPDATLLEVRPETGRTHQIRVHLAGAHHPILGDDLYGPRPGRESAYRKTGVRLGFRDRLALHAWKIVFRHPVSGKPVAVTAPLPPEFDRLRAA
jgi:23S rRNA pseudouridine1911/1915/1917 synthase